MAVSVGGELLLTTSTPWVIAAYSVRCEARLWPLLHWRFLDRHANQASIGPHVMSFVLHIRSQIADEGFVPAIMLLLAET